MPVCHRDVHYLIWQHLNSVGFAEIADELWNSARLSEFFKPEDRILPRFALVGLLTRSLRSMRRTKSESLSLFEASRRISRGCHNQEGYFINEIDETVCLTEDEVSSDEEEMPSHENDGDVQVLSAIHPMIITNPPVLQDERMSIMYNSGIQCLWSPDANIIACDSPDNAVQLRSIEKSDRLSIVKTDWLSVGCGGISDRLCKKITSFDWSPDTLKLATSHFDGIVRLWSDARMIQHRLVGHVGPVYVAKWNPNGEFLATGGADRKTIIWNNDGQVHISYFCHDAAVLDMTWLSHDTFASCSTENIHINKLGLHMPIMSLLGHTASVISLKFDKISSYLTSSSEDSTIKVWTPIRGEARITIDSQKHLKCFDIDPKGFHIARNGQYLASGDTQGCIVVWNMNTFEILLTIPHKTGGSILQIDWNNENDLIAATTANGHLMIADVTEFV